MYVSGSFTLPNPLGPNLNFSTISPTLYSFSDGRSTIDQMNGFAPSFTISTDSSGNIKAFDTEIFVQTFATTGDFVRDIGIYLGQTDFGEIFLCLGAAGGSCVSGNGGDDNGQSFTAGIWSTSPIAAVPLPPTITLFASGLGGLGLIALRRRRKKTA
jgi:MYXO-CTERM domain-containing protein